MKLSAMLELDKEKLIAKLKEAGTPERAVPVLEFEADRLAAAAAEEASSAREAEAASLAFGTLRMAMRFSDCAGEAKVWELRSGSPDKRDTEKGSFSLPALSLLIAGAALIAAGFLTAVIGGGLMHMVSAPVLIILTLIGAVCLFASGLLRGRGKKASESGKLMTEQRVDAEQLYRVFHSSVIVAEEGLEEIRRSEEYLNRTASADGSDPVSSEELSYFASLMEASCSGDEALMKERINDAKYLLHKRNVEVVEFSEDSRAAFDLMPSFREGTLRPAFVSDGKVLKRGIAGYKTE